MLLTHPGQLSYTIFTQAGEAVRDDPNILGGPSSELLIAAGESQSAGRMVTDIDAVHPLEHTYAGYLVHSRNIAGSPLSQTPLPAISAPSPTLIRSDLDVPVFTVQAEDDVPKYFAARQADTDKLRTWEMAGTSHADQYTLGVGQPDTGDGTGAEQMFARMLNPTNDPLPGILPPCPKPVNAGPHHWLLQAALHHPWGGRTASPRPRRRGSSTTGRPSPSTPTATSSAGCAHRSSMPRWRRCGARATRAAAPTSAGCSGSPPRSARPKARDTLYRNHGQFVSKWTKATNDAVKRTAICSGPMRGGAPPRGTHSTVGK